MPDAYRVSLEKAELHDTASNHIGYTAVAPLSEVLQTPYGPQGQRGKGADGQEWGCLECLENLFVDLFERRKEDPPGGPLRGAHPISIIENFVKVEERTISDYPGRYTLKPLHKHAFEMWKAVKLYDNCRSMPKSHIFILPKPPPKEDVKLFPGQSRETFYTNLEMSNK